MRSKNRTRFARAAFFIALFAVCPSLAFAGAWTVPDGGWYLEQYTSFFTSDTDFNRTGDRREKEFQGVYTEINSKSLVEYGLTDRVNVLFAIPYKRINYVNDYDNLGNAGFSDVSLGGKYRILEAPAVVSVSVTGSVPGGYSRGAALPLGPGSENIEGRLYVSQSFFWINSTPSQPGWSRLVLSAEGAKDKYGLPFLAEVNYFPIPWLYGKLLLSGIHNAPRQPDGQDYIKWNASLTLTSTGSGSVLRSGGQNSFNLGLGYGQTFNGRNTGLGSEYTMSLSYIF